MRVTSARKLGLTGAELPGEPMEQACAIAEEVRQWAAARCGLTAEITPYQIPVGPPQAYRPSRATTQSEVDLAARMVAKGGIMHKAFPGGGSVCLSVAAQIEGTVAAEARQPSGAQKIILRMSLRGE
jgi:2-methylaconitate cis-trans-isomerase PrpF